MKRYRQTRFGARYGNCMATCLACLLEIPVWKVPDMHGGHATDVQKYLRSIGLDWFEVEVRTGANVTHFQ